MATKFKISVVVHPLPLASAIPDTQKQQKFLQFAAPESNLAQLWRQIETFYKTNYLAQSLHNSFAIKKIQDEDGNDLDIFYKLSDIFTATEKKVLNVIQARVDRDVSIPVTSHLRPAEAFRRPLPPPFHAQPYVNFDPDKPVSSTERDSEEREHEDEHANRGRRQSDESHLDEAVNNEMLPQDRHQKARETDVINGYEDHRNDSSLQDRVHEADDEDDVEVQHSRRNNTRQLPQDDILAASDRVLASLGTQHRAAPTMFAKPALPPPRVQSQRPGQLRSGEKVVSGLLSRSVSNPHLRASVSAKSPHSNAFSYDQNNPFELPESEGISPDEQSQTDTVNNQRSIRGASRSAVLRNNNANTHPSSHAAAAITPPTSTESLPQLGNRLDGNKAGTTANTNTTAPFSRRISGQSADRSQARASTPATANKNLTRVLSRSIIATKAPSGNLAVPPASGAPKLLSPFQPVLPAVGADAPSFTTDDAVGSQSSSVGNLMQKVGAGHVQAPPVHPKGLPSNPLDAHIDDVEDSMHEDVLQRAAARRQGPGTSKQVPIKKSTLEVVPRSSLASQPGRSSSRISSAPSVTPAAQKTKETPTITGRDGQVDTAPLQPLPAVTKSKNTTKSTPAPLAKADSSTKKKPRAEGSLPARKPGTACESCRKGKKRCIHNMDGSILPSSQPQQLRPQEMDWVRGLASSAIKQVTEERAQNQETEPDVDVVMEDNTQHDADMTEELRESLNVPPQLGPDHLDHMEVQRTTDAEQLLQDKVRNGRNAQTLTWLRQQQEEAQRTVAVAQSEQQMQERRTASRDQQDEDSAEFAHKKPDRKGKGRAVHNEDDVALLKSAGLPVSDELMDDVDDASEEDASDLSSDDDDAEAGPSNAVPRKRSSRRPSNQSSPQRQGKSRASPPFAVVIPTSPEKTGLEPPQAPTQNSELPESTPLDSQGLPTSAQPIRKATRRSSVISPTNVAHAAVPSSNTVVETIAQKLKPSQEFFAFLPDKPEPLPTKRSYKRKAPGSSPPDNLASELHRRSPETKKRKTEHTSSLSKSKSKAVPSVDAKGSSQKRPVVVESDEERVEARPKSSSRSGRASTAAPPQRPVIVLDHANESPSRKRRASTNASTAKQQPIVVDSDIELVQKNDNSPSKSRRANTAVPANGEHTGTQRSPSVSRRRASHTNSNIVTLDGPADSPSRSIRAQEDSVKKNEANPPRRPSAPHRPSAQLINQLRNGASRTSADESTSQGSVDNDVSMIDDELDNAESEAEMPTGTTIDKGKTEQLNTSKFGKKTNSGSEELETGLQSSAQRAHDSEERRKSEMDEAIANYVPPLSFPIPSSQPSPPLQPIQASQNSTIAVPSQISQTSTTRSPESSPRRSTQESNQPTLPPYRQRSSSPDWLTPQWVRDKEADEADRLEEEQEKRKAELRISAKKSPAAKGQPIAASNNTTPAASAKKPSMVQKEKIQAHDEDSGEVESDSEGDEHDNTSTPKPSQSMPPPPVPSTPAASSRNVPATPLKSILKKSSSSLSSASASQPNRKVAMEPPRSSAVDKSSSAPQSKPQTNGKTPQTNGKLDVLKNGTSTQSSAKKASQPVKNDIAPSQSSARKASQSVKNGTAPPQSSAKKAPQPVKNTPFIEDDSSSTDGDVEDNEVTAPAPSTKLPAQSQKIPANAPPKKVSAIPAQRKQKPSSSSDSDDSTPEPQYRSRTNFAPAASQPAPNTNNKINGNTARTSASSPIRKAAAPPSDSDRATTSSDESGESGYSRESDVPEDVEREVARLMAADSRAKIGATRQIVKFDQRMARRSQREEDKHNAPRRKRTQDLKDMLQGAGLEDPMRALSKRGSGRA